MHQGGNGFETYELKEVYYKDTREVGVSVYVHQAASLYFSYGKDSVNAYFTSNRTESKHFIDLAHGNDIYTYEMVQKAIDEIKELVPLTLYFDNDMPDPNSQESTTTSDYEELVRLYLDKKLEYLEQNSKGADDELQKYNIYRCFW